MSELQNGLILLLLMVIALAAVFLVGLIENVVNELRKLNQRLENNTDKSGTLFVGTTKAVL